MNQPVSQVAWKVRAVVRRAVFFHAPRHVHPRPPLHGQFDVRIRFVVPEQHVEARAVLLDQIVLERQRFLLVVQQDVVQSEASRIRLPVFASASRSSLK